MLFSLIQTLMREDGSAQNAKKMPYASECSLFLSQVVSSVESGGVAGTDAAELALLTLISILPRDVFAEWVSSLPRKKDKFCFFFFFSFCFLCSSIRSEDQGSSAQSFTCRNSSPFRISASELVCHVGFRCKNIGQVVSDGSHCFGCSNSELSERNPCMDSVF